MANADFDTIMEKITSGLVGDPSKDIPYLEEKMEEYKTHQYAKEILRACGRLVFSLMPEDAKEKFEQLIGNHTLGVSAVIEEAQFNMYKKRFDVAKDMLASMAEKLEAANLYQDDSVSEYHTFNSLFEEILYANIHNPEKELRRATEPYSVLYLNLGSVLFELGDLKGAKTALAKAIHWNPIDPDITFEYAETFKVQGKLDDFFRLTMLAFSHSYKKTHLARCYRNLGYYFVEKELWKMAAGCYLFSTHYEKEHKSAQSELWYIQQKAGPYFEPPSHAELLEGFNKYNIPLGADRDVVGILIALGHEGKKQDNPSFARHFLEMAYDLTDSEEIKEMLNELPPVKTTDE